ncbi:uncharacterized protein LOC119333496 [Triticum dicoccoides]|uniref:uncharacterized protein LOC119333496 n=1 Tax=Triticum dicoccoides TaxID=85692 RepID=UPI001891BB31|nr:uncharacterized protein LOC119333496 [Triticum dicoccoides]
MHRLLQHEGRGQGQRNQGELEATKLPPEPRPSPSPRLPSVPRPHLLRGSHRHLAPTFSSAPASTSPPLPPRLPPSPRPHLLGGSRRHLAPHSTAASLPPTGHLPLPVSLASSLCLLLAALDDAPSGHSASSIVGGPSTLRPAVQPRHPRPFTVQCPFPSHHERSNPGTPGSSNIHRLAGDQLPHLYKLVGDDLAVAGIPYNSQIPALPATARDPCWHRQSTGVGVACPSTNKNRRCNLASTMLAVPLFCLVAAPSCNTSCCHHLYRATAPPTCPLSQPHHSLPMHSNPSTSMMEVVSQPSDELTHLPCASFAHCVPCCP